MIVSFVTTDYSRTCLIRHSFGSEKLVGLERLKCILKRSLACIEIMSEIAGHYAYCPVGMTSLCELTNEGDILQNA